MKDFGNEQPLVLVIDDQREALEKVTAVLSAANLACRCCTTSEEAIAANIAALSAVGIAATRDMFDTTLLAEI